MGRVLLLVVLKTLALRTGNEHYKRCARFWTKIFAINFTMGVVTGIPMEFQFGTNWATFSKAAGGVAGPQHDRSGSDRKLYDGGRGARFTCSPTTTKLMTARSCAWA